MASVAATLPVPRGGLRFLGALALAPAVLGVSLLLPDHGAGLGIRLAAAAACVLLLPGALVQRVIGWPTSVAVAVAGALAWSLAAIFFAFTLTFAANGSLSLTIAVLAVVMVSCLVTAVQAGALPRVDPSERQVLLWILGAAAVFAGIVWWASSSTVSGDGLFHLARARKIEEFDVLASVRSPREFGDGGNHPGYAFPLWHGVLALIARFASVDTAEVVLHLGALLVPLAFLVTYAAGRALFRSWAGGAAALAAQVAIVGFSREGTGSFELLALPATSSRLLLVPTVLALAFALAGGAHWSGAGALAAAGLALTLVHPTYAFFLAIPLAGFLAARALLGPRDLAGLVRIAFALPALLVPFAAYTLWIRPILNSTIARGGDDRVRAIEHYAGQLDVSGDLIRLAPDAIARGGAVVVAALLAVPFAALAARRLWASYVLGATVVVLVLALVPQLFTPFADGVSISQGRRLVLFLPLAFAFAGACVLAGRWRWKGAAAALALGIGLQLAYPGEFTYRLGEGGPGWAVWAALLGGGIGLALAAWKRWNGPNPNVWAAVVAAAFVLPVAVGGFASLERHGRADPYALSPGLVERLREIDRRAVVYSNLETSYRIAAYVPVRIAAAPPAHVARTKLNRPYERRRDVVRFFFRTDTTTAEREKILDDYAASWVVVDTTREYPAGFLERLRKVYDDGRYRLYEVSPE